MNLAYASRRRGLAVYLFCLLLGSPSFPAFAQGGEVVARVGDRDVTEAEVRTFLQTLDADTRKKALDNPDLFKQLLRDHYKEVLLDNEARAKGWDKRPDVQAKIEAESKLVVDRSYLDSVSVPPADYPPEQDMQTLYNNNKQQFTDPRAYHLGEIFIKVDAGADEAAKDAAQAKAADLARRARAPGADFAALARENSQDPSAAQGGDVGFISGTRLTPAAVSSAVTSMAVGSVSDPIRTPGGFVVLHLVETRPPSLHPFSEVQGGIRDFLRQRRQQELERVYIDGLIKNSPVTINELALSRLGESLK